MRDFAGVVDQIVGQQSGGMQAGDETSWMQRRPREHPSASAPPAARNVTHDVTNSTARAYITCARKHLMQL